MLMLQTKALGFPGIWREWIRCRVLKPFFTFAHCDLKLGRRERPASGVRRPSSVHPPHDAVGPRVRWRGDALQSFFALQILLKHMSEVDSNEMDDFSFQLGDDFQHPLTQPSGISNVGHDKKPKIGQEFDSLAEVYRFYNEYGKRLGFSVRTGGSHKKGDGVIRKEYLCSKEGVTHIVSDVEKKRRRGLSREDCKAKLAVVKSGSKYKVSVFVEQHSHELTTPSKVHLLRSQRKFNATKRSIVGVLDVANVPKHTQMSILELTADGYENVACTETDLRNGRRDSRKSISGHDAEMLNEYFESEQENNPTFFYEIEVDSDNRITACFWADVTCRRAYSCFGDVVVFDTTYNTNRYGMIFVPIIGVNNHGQTILFGCGFLSNESTESFIWLFNKWMKAMPAGPPKLIITNQDPAMLIAIGEVFLGTLHRFCIWHIMNKFSEKLGTRVWMDHYKKFSSCIYDSDTPQEFESKWMEALVQSGLQEHEWLQRMYALRSKWIPAFVKDILAAGMSSSQRAKSNHAFFKRFVDKNNSFIEFVTQLHRAFRKQRNGELERDHKDKHERPALKTKFRIEKQMVDFYTCEMFLMFQEEIQECMWYSCQVKEDDGVRSCVYWVRKANEEGDKVREIVEDKNEDKVRCSCKKFDWEGILCRHMLHYLIFNKHLTQLPEKYMLSRWGKTAKSSRVLDGSGIEVEGTCDTSLLLRRNRLYQKFGTVLDEALLSKENIQKLDLFLTSFHDEIVLRGRNSNDVEEVCTKSNASVH